MDGKKFDKSVRTEMGAMAKHIIRDDYVEAEKSLRSGVAVYVADSIAKGISEIRKQENASR